jgi:hypothetical protein
MTQKRHPHVLVIGFWEGGVNRADLIEAFGISALRASEDLSLYQKQRRETRRTTSAPSGTPPCSKSRRRSTYVKPIVLRSKIRSVHLSEAD